MQRWRWLVMSLILVALVVLAANAQLVKAQDATATNPLTAPNADCFERFLADFNAIKGKPQVTGISLFSPFGDNADFTKHTIPQSKMAEICPPNGSCAGSKVGINPGTIYGAAGANWPSRYYFDWFLQIATSSNQASVTSTINSLPENTKAIIRIGIGGGGLGFEGQNGASADPQVYLSYLKNVWAGLTPAKRLTTYVIAGPNEPDIEADWFAPKCGSYTQGESFYQCIGPILANYMNQIIIGNPGFKLLSPTFNMTSYTLNDVGSASEGIFGAMNKNKENVVANWGGLTAISGNLYPNQAPMTQHWDGHGIQTLLDTAGKNLVITETGPMGCNLQTEIKTNDFYIQPIKGIGIQGLDSEVQMDFIRNDLVSQGYEAHCASKGFVLNLTQDGRNAMEKLFKQPANDPNGVQLGLTSQNPPGGTLVTEGGIRMKFVDNLTMYSVVSTDFRNSLSPIFRDLDRTSPSLKRSLEDYFGFKSFPGGSLSTVAELNSAAINSLVSNEQRCALAYHSLLARDTMCKKLENPDTCSLYQAEIPSGGYNARSLLQAFQAKTGLTGGLDAPGASAGQAALGACRTLLASTTKADQILVKALLDAPLTIEKAYRLAFLVTSVRLRTPNGGQFNNLFTHPLGGWLGPPRPNHHVIVAAFKVPDVGTNKGPTTTDQQTDTPYKDVVELTRNTLLTTDQTRQINSAGMQFRQLLMDAAAAASYEEQYDNTHEIACLGGSRLTGVGSPLCKEPLTKAIVDIINGEAKLIDLPLVDNPTTPTDKQLSAYIKSMIETDGESICPNGDAEPATVINDPGKLTPTDDASHVFRADVGAALLANLWSGEDCSHITISADGKGSSADPNFASSQEPSTGACQWESKGTDDWYLKSKYFVAAPFFAPESGNNDKLAVKQYLVYPAGYDLRTMESVMAGSFFTAAQMKNIVSVALADKTLTDRLRIEQAATTFKGAQASYSYTDRSEPCPTETIRDPIDGSVIEVIQKCPTRSFGFQLNADEIKPLGVLGGTLGFWVRQVQLALNSAASPAYGYLKTCKTIEEFLLDRCGTSSGLPWISGANQIPPIPGQQMPFIRPSNAGTCQPIDQPGNYCDQAYLRKYFVDAGVTEAEGLTERVKIASTVCNGESGGNPNALNMHCLASGPKASYDYSVGLFQYNLVLSGRCVNANKQDAVKGLGGALALQQQVSCIIQDSAQLAQCQQQLLNPDYNIRNMLNQSVKGKYWGAWSVAKSCGIVNDKGVLQPPYRWPSWAHDMGITP